jgi:hypothetical protein
MRALTKNAFHQKKNGKRSEIHPVFHTMVDSLLTIGLAISDYGCAYMHMHMHMTIERVQKHRLPIHVTAVDR